MAEMSGQPRGEPCGEHLHARSFTLCGAKRCMCRKRGIIAGDDILTVKGDKRTQVCNQRECLCTFIGRNSTAAQAQDWMGNIAQVGIIGAVLSPEEITELYNNGNGVSYSEFFGGP